MAFEEKLPPVVILAGGLGTRLRPSYATGPKAMAPVGERPFLDYLLSWLRSEGAAEVVVCVGYKRSQIQRHVRRGYKWGMRVRYSIEKQLLGTAGAVKKVEQLISDEQLFVINGDTLIDISLRNMLEFHQQRRALATLAIVRMKDKKRYGAVRLDSEARITRFAEKAQLSPPCRVGRVDLWINGGVYLIQRKILSAITPDVATSFEKQVFPKLVRNGKIFGFKSHGYFLDIGVPDDFERAQAELPERNQNYHSH